jgi:hypothetical protein
MSPYNVLISFCGLTGILVCLTLFLRKAWTTGSRVRSFVVNSVVTLSSLFYLFLALELLFYTCFTFSDGADFTLASRRWNEKYWHPINSFGYRDIEHDPASFVGKRLIIVLGDSFAAGHGIENYGDRFSDVLKSELGTDYVVVNVAKNGWDTSDEYRALRSYPNIPETVVLSYVLNDIVGAAHKEEYDTPVLVTPPPKALAYVLDHSYSLNFGYWRLYRSVNTDMGARYWQYLERCHNNPAIWRTHQAELLDIINYARSFNVKLIVIVFPNLRFVKSSEDMTAKVATFFRQNNVRALDLAPLLEGQNPTNLMVNALDAHPSKSLHREVAELLLHEISNSEKRPPGSAIGK